MALQTHLIGILHVVWLLVGLTVEIDDMILYLQRLTRQSHTAFHVVLTTVCGTGDDLAVLSLILSDGLTSGLVDSIEIPDPLFCRQRVGIRTFGIDLIADAIAHLIIVHSLIPLIRAERVTSRIVEYHDIVQFHLTQAFHPAIIPMRPLDIRLALYDWQRVLRQRHRQRRLRDAWPVAHFRYEEIIARQQRLLQ